MALSRRPQRFSFARDSDPSQLAQFIGGEHPQTIALILSHLQATQAAQTMTHLMPGCRAPKSHCASPRWIALHQKWSSRSKKFSSASSARSSAATSRRSAGTQFLVNMLTTVDRGTEKQILEFLDGANAELATEVRKLMFVFDDLVRLDDRSMQRALREVDSKDLSLAMRGTSEELQERIFRNQSTRAAQALKEEMEIGGPVRLRQVEEAQQRIVNIVRRLEDAEEIVVQRGGEDVLV